jgi:hypothetical protein
MALNLPRISNDPGSDYRPRNFIATWDLLCDLLEAAFNEGGAGGGGALAAEYFQNGWLSAQDEAGAIGAPNSPNLTVTLRGGGRIVQNGALLVVDGDTIIDGAPANTVSYLTLEHSIGGDDADIWEPTWHETRPALGAGVLAKITTDADSVTAVDVSEAETDLIPEMPYLLALIYSGGNSGNGGENGPAFWDLLKRSAVNAQTIAQFVGSEIEARLGGTGTNLLPPEVRDEVMVNALHSLALHQNSHNNAFEAVPPHHAIVVSPGRGSGDWAYDELTDEALTTMPVNEISHEFGSAP